MQTFKIDNIPVNSVSFKSEFEPNEQILQLHTEIFGYIETECVNFKSQAIRDTLIAMGWVPPETGHAIKNVIARMKNDYGVVDYWIKELRDAINQTDPAHE